jgi:hypothetical protein
MGRAGFYLTARCGRHEHKRLGGASHGRNEFGLLLALRDGTKQGGLVKKVGRAMSPDRRKVASTRVKERATSAGTKPNGDVALSCRSTWSSERPTRMGRDGQNDGMPLDRLEAENAKLRKKAVDLALQIQALRDAVGARLP